MRKVIAATLGVAALAAIGGYLGVSYVVAERFTHVDRKAVTRGPFVMTSTYEDITLRTSDGLSLYGWYFPAKGDRAAVVVHGKDSNRIEGNERGEHIADFLIADGFSVVLFDMRGHGNSQGDRFSLGYLERRDVAAAIEFLEAHGFAEGRIALIGSSMGAGTVLQELLLHPGVGAVVADSAYEDVPMLLDEDLQSQAGVPGWFTPGVLLMARLAFGIDGTAARPIEVVRAHPERAIFFIHCDSDELIAVHHARDLRNASANSASALWIVSGCAHARAEDGNPDEYRLRVLAYLDATISTIAR